MSRAATPLDRGCERRIKVTGLSPMNPIHGAAPGTRLPRVHTRARRNAVEHRDLGSALVRVRTWTESAPAQRVGIEVGVGPEVWAANGVATVDRYEFRRESHHRTLASDQTIGTDLALLDATGQAEAGP